MINLHGILTALPFPFPAGGPWRRAVLEKHINDSLRAGVHGFWVNGATACSIHLDKEDRKRALEATLNIVAGRVPVLVMVSALKLPEGIELAQHAGTAGVAGVSAMPPLVYPTTFNEIVGYLKTLQDAAGLPMTYYHVPGLTKVALAAGQLADLCEQVPLVAIKFSEVDFFKAIEIQHRCPKVSILTGYEELLLGGLAMRCVSGTVGASQNFVPGPLVELYRAFHSGDLVRPQRLHAGLARVIAVQEKFNNTAATYALLKLLGYDYGDPPPPLRRLDDVAVQSLKEELLKVIRPDPFREGRLIEGRDLLYSK